MRTTPGSAVAGSVSATGTALASYLPTNSCAPLTGLPLSSFGCSETSPSVASGEAKLGIGSASVLPLEKASSPRPRLANAFHRVAWLAPPKRSWSAASIASRASTMLAGDVVADVGVVERVAVQAVVADARDLVAGHVGADGEAVLAVDRHEAVLVEVLHGVQVGPGLAHGPGLRPSQPDVRPTDHAVADGVGVLVADHRHVVVTVDARRVEGGGDRLPQVHVGDRGDAVRRGDLVGVVAGGEVRRPADDAAGLRVALLGVGLGAAEPEVGLLQVEGLLGEAEEVRPVVHAVVHREQVRDRGVEVVALRAGVHVRAAALLEPLVGPWIGVGAVGPRAGRVDAHREGVVVVQVLDPVRVVAGGGVGRLAGGWVDVPSVAGGRVLQYPVAAGARLGPAPQLAGVARGVVEPRAGREGLPLGVVVGVVDQRIAPPDLAGLGVDPAQECQRVATGGVVEDDRLPHRPHAVARRRQGAQARRLASLEAGGPLPGRLGRDPGRARRRAVAGDRGGRVSDLAADDADGDQAVGGRDGVAEALAEGDHAALADGCLHDHVEPVDLRAAQAEQGVVTLQPGPGGRAVVARQPAGEPAVALEDRERGAEGVPAHPRARRQVPLRGAGADVAAAGVDAAGGGALALEAELAGGRRCLGDGRQYAGHGGDHGDDEERYPPAPPVPGEPGGHRLAPLERPRPGGARRRLAGTGRCVSGPRQAWWGRGARAGRLLTSMHHPAACQWFARFLPDAYVAAQS